MCRYKFNTIIVLYNKIIDVFHLQCNYTNLKDCKYIKFLCVINVKTVYKYVKTRKYIKM